MRELKYKILVVLSGVIAAVFVIEIGLRITGWVYLFNDNIRNKNTLAKTKDKDAIRILSLGPCYTVGVGAMPQDSYPYQLESILKKNHPGRSYIVYNKGVRGKDLSFFVNNLEELSSKLKPQLVILNINRRVDLKSDNFILANRDLLSLQDRIMIGGINLLNRSKVFRLVSLLFKPQVKKQTEESDHSKRVLFGLGADEKGISAYGADVSVFKGKSITEPMSEQNWINLANAYALQGIYDSAIKSMTNAIKINPGNSWNYFELFWYYSQLGEYDTALKMLRKSRRVNKDTYKFVSEKVKEFEKQPHIDPARASDYYLLFRYYIFLGKFSKAGMLNRQCELLVRDWHDISQYNIIAWYRFVNHMKRTDGKPENLLEDESRFDITETKVNNLMLIKGFKISGKHLSAREMFYRLLKYDLKKARQIASKYRSEIILENMASSSQHQEIIKSVCDELDIKLIDLYGAFMSMPDYKSFFYNYPKEFRLNKEGNKFIAEHIYNGILESGFLDRN